MIHSDSRFTDLISNYSYNNAVNREKKRRESGFCISTFQLYPQLCKMYL